MEKRANFKITTEDLRKQIEEKIDVAVDYCVLPCVLPFQTDDNDGAEKI